mgnify:CR=1 FL=1
MQKDRLEMAAAIFNHEFTSAKAGWEGDSSAERRCMDKFCP